MQITVSAAIITVFLAGSLAFKTTSIEDNRQCEVEDLATCRGAEDKRSTKYAETLLDDSAESGAKMLLKKMEDECEAEEKEKDKENSILNCINSIDKSIEDYRKMHFIYDGERLKRKPKDLSKSEVDANNSAEEDNEPEDPKHESGEEEDEEKEDNDTESLKSNNINSEENNEDDTESKSDKIVENDESSSNERSDEVESSDQSSRVTESDKSSNEKEDDPIENEEGKEEEGSEVNENENAEEEKRELESDKPEKENSSGETKEENDSNNKHLRSSVDAELMDYLRNKRGYDIGLAYYNPWMFNKFKYM